MPKTRTEDEVRGPRCCSGSGLGGVYDHASLYEARDGVWVKLKEFPHDKNATILVIEKLSGAAFIGNIRHGDPVGQYVLSVLIQEALRTK